LAAGAVVAPAAGAVVAPAAGFGASVGLAAAAWVGAAGAEVGAAGWDVGPQAVPIREMVASAAASDDMRTGRPVATDYAPSLKKDFLCV
jgi:hypothetical protein